MYHVRAKCLNGIIFMTSGYFLAVNEDWFSVKSKAHTFHQNPTIKYYQGMTEITKDIFLRAFQQCETDTSQEPMNMII